MNPASFSLRAALMAEDNWLSVRQAEEGEAASSYFFWASGASVFNTAAESRDADIAGGDE